MMAIQPNALYQADCFALLERLDNESVSLVYIDPPRFDETDATDPQLSFDVGFQQHLEFLSRVFQQAQRVLTNEGSLFLHSEPGLTAYIRLLLDQIFLRRNFRSEFIVPKQRPLGSSGPHLSHESILMYSKGEKFTYIELTRPLSKEEIRTRFGSSDDRGPYRLSDLTVSVSRSNMRKPWHDIVPPQGRSWRYSLEKMEELERDNHIYFSEAGKMPRLKVYLSEGAEVEIGALWNDVPPIPDRSERTGYVSQRSVAIMKRVILVGSNPGDTVLDPFFGSGTTLVAAHQLGRSWIGCDTLDKAYSTAINRLSRVCKVKEENDYESGTQRELAERHPIFFRVYRKVEVSMGRPKKVSFAYGRPIELDETRNCEFKEIKGTHAARSIRDVADQYAVGFLNREGGTIFWGVRDSDHVVVGVTLDIADRDEVRRVVTERLIGIRPAIPPSLYKLEIYPVENAPEADLYIVELSVPRVATKDLFFTSKDEAWIKTDGGKIQLKGPQLQQEVLRRFNLE